MHFMWRGNESKGHLCALQVMREVAIMKKLSHQNIVKLYEVIDDPQGQFLFLVLEYVEMGAICSSDQMEQQARAQLPVPRRPTFTRVSLPSAALLAPALPTLP